MPELARRREAVFAEKAVSFVAWSPCMMVVLCGLHCGLCAPLVNAGPEGVSGYLAAGERLKKGQWADAQIRYRRILETGPELLRPHATLGLSRSIMGLGEGETALGILKSVLDEGNARYVNEKHWLALIALERAELLHQLGRGVEAIRELEEVLTTLEDRALHARLKNEVLLAMAKLMSRAGEPRRAIKALTDSLPALRSAECAGLRARQKAWLAKIYMGAGERDWAVSLLEEIRHDPQMSPRHFTVAEAFVENRELGGTGVRGFVVRENRGYLVICSPGCFEIRVAVGEGEDEERISGNCHAITHWFNLKADPFGTTNLLAGGSLLEIIESTASHGAWAHGPAIIELLESSSARVRFQRRDASFPATRFEEYTVYPSGRIFVLLGREGPRPSESRIELLLTTPRLIRPTGWHVIDPRTNLPVKAGTVFRGQHLLFSGLPLPSNHWSAPGDLLLMPSWTGSRLGTRVPRDAGKTMHHRISCKDCGKEDRLALQLRIIPSFLEKTGLAEECRKDYQYPGDLSVQGGEIFTDDPGDLNSDGYNESEGCHVVSGGRILEFRAGDHDRPNPVFKFVSPAFVGIPDVIVDGRIADSSFYKLCWVDPETLILCWHGTIPAGGRVRFTLE